MILFISFLLDRCEFIYLCSRSRLIHLLVTYNYIYRLMIKWVKIGWFDIGILCYYGIKLNHILWHLTYLSLLCTEHLKFQHLMFLSTHMMHYFYIIFILCNRSLECIPPKWYIVSLVSHPLTLSLDSATAISISLSYALLDSMNKNICSFVLDLFYLLLYFLDSFSCPMAEFAF